MGSATVELGPFRCFLAQKAKFVRGVEIVPAAIEDARRNAQTERISSNVEFFVGKAEEVLADVNTRKMVCMQM